jgi:chromosome segregation ATPase
MESRLDTMGNQFGTMESRLDTMGNQFGTMESRLDTMGNQFGTVEGRLDTMGNQFGTMESQLVNLTEQQSETNRKLTKLETTIENTTNTKILALFEDREVIHSKLDNITNELVDIKEQITDHDIKIQVISNKTKAI